MSMERERWTVQKVLSGRGLSSRWRWTYTLRDGGRSLANYATSKEAAKAAEREWKKAP